MTAMRTIVGEFVDPDGTIAHGQVEFRLTAPLRDTGGNTLIIPMSHWIPIRGGRLEADVVVTEGPGILPEDVRYRVTIRLVGHSDWDPLYLAVPSSSDPLSLAEATES